tara:strand:+ start:595 stop:726 length:132 start_codon:yes stop_codon:yes gene_type:complete
VPEYQMIYSGEEDFDVNLVMLTKLIKIFNSDKGIYFERTVIID